MEEGGVREKERERGRQAPGRKEAEDRRGWRKVSGEGKEVDE